MSYIYVDKGSLAPHPLKNETERWVGLGPITLVILVPDTISNINFGNPVNFVQVFSEIYSKAS